MLRFDVAELTVLWAERVGEGVTVGAKRIDVAQKAVTASSLRFSVTEGYGKPTGLKFFGFSPGPCDPEPFQYEL